MKIHVETPTLRGAAADRLADEWRNLEARADGSFFQSWSWIGCLAAERFDAPLLLRATVAGETVGLALFNRHKLELAPRALWLHETGDPADDSVFIEHNGPLVAHGHEATTRAMLRAALREGGSVILSGISSTLLDEVRRCGIVHIRAERRAPYADLRHGAAAWLARRGAATRAQLARTRKRLASLGSLAWHPAQSVEEALDYLDGLARLHQAAWTARGHPGAFARPEFLRFHTALIRRALPRGESMFCRLAADSKPLAYLLNFAWKDTVLAYQSGFDLTVPRASPGLLAHAMAIETATTAQLARYDMLAGDTRYKRELTDGALTLHWVEVAGYRHLRGLPLAWIRRFRGWQHRPAEAAGSQSR